MLPIETIIAQGESETLEFKPSFNQDVIETAAARANHSSKPRNRLIAQAFYDMGMIEQYGSGIERVINACVKAGLPVPVFENFSGGFQVVFRPVRQAALPVGEHAAAQVTAQEIGRAHV